MNTRLQTVRRIGLGSIAIGLPVLVGATDTAAADGPGTTSDVIGCWGGTGGSWGMMGGGWGMGGGGGWGMGPGLFGGGTFLWPLLLLGLVALAVYALGNRGGGATERRSGFANDRRTSRRTDPALTELRERYARGELSEEEFERKRRTLEH
jgi:putative membrane protein